MDYFLISYTYNTQLKKKPTINIPVATIPINVAIKGHFNTFLRIIISGRDNPIVDIMKANAVPRGTPFSINTLTIGIIPAALEYKGTPTKTDNGTEYQWDLSIIETIKFSGTKPCIPAPMPTPITI